VSSIKQDGKKKTMVVCDNMSMVTPDIKDKTEGKEEKKSKLHVQKGQQYLQIEGGLQKNSFRRSRRGRGSNGRPPEKRNWREKGKQVQKTEKRADDILIPEETRRGKRTRLGRDKRNW